MDLKCKNKGGKFEEDHEKGEKGNQDPYSEIVTHRWLVKTVHIEVGSH